MPYGPLVSITPLGLSITNMSDATNFFGVSPATAMKRFMSIMDKEIDIIDRDFKRTYRTWRHKPYFVKKVTLTSTSITGEVYTTDEIYGYLDEGTDVRWTAMDPRFKPKTTVRTIGSRKGAYPDPVRMVTKPRPGIEARKFVDEIWKRRQTMFMKRFRVATERMVWRKIK